LIYEIHVTSISPDPMYEMSELRSKQQNFIFFWALWVRLVVGWCHLIGDDILLRNNLITGLFYFRHATRLDPSRHCYTYYVRPRPTVLDPMIRAPTVVRFSGEPLKSRFRSFGV